MEAGGLGLAAADRVGTCQIVERWKNTLLVVFFTWQTKKYLVTYGPLSTFLNTWP